MRIQTHSRRGALAALAIAAATLPALGEETAPPADCGEVVLAEFAWATAGLATRLLEIALSDGYGCEVRRQPADPTRALGAVRASQEAMAAAQAAAAPLEAAPIAPPPAVIAVGAAADGLGAQDGAALGAELYGGLDRGGWFAPRWLTAAHPNLRRIEDAARNPQIFTASRREKPKLHICPAAWPCHADDRALIRQLGLEETFEIVVPASGDELTQSLTDAWRHRRPWLGSYWTPSSAVAEYAMTRLESGNLEICDGGSKQDCRPPHRTAPRLTLYPRALEESAPRVAASLRRFALPPELALEALAWRATNNADLDDAALQLLDSRPGLWRSWLDETARQRFEPALRDRLREADERAARAKAERLADRRLARQDAEDGDDAPVEAGEKPAGGPPQG